MQAEIMSQDTQTDRQKLFPLLSTSFQNAILSIPDEYLAMNELELSKIIEPSPVDFMLRQSIWKKFEVAEKNPHIKEITNQEIFKGICTGPNWYNRVLQTPARVAWLTLPIIDKTEAMEEALHFGLLKIRNELLTMPMNEKTAGTILKAVEFLANRVLGQVVQRVESKNLNLNVGNGGKEAPISREAVEAEILKLQNQMKAQDDAKFIEAAKSIEET